MAAQLISEAEELAEISKLAPEASCTRIASIIAGLDAEEAARRLAAAGSSIVTRQHRPTVLAELWGHTRNPLNALLLTLAATSALMGDMRAAIVIAVIIVLAILTGFVQEHRSNNARRGLQAMVKTTASVRRRTAAAAGDFLEVPIETLVPGDV